jgi:aldehyde dehydrogenase (NAD+)
MTETATPIATDRAAAEPPTFRHFIAGEWCESTSGATFESHNPADARDVIGRFQQGTAADVAMAIRAADVAGAMWRRTPAPKRGEILYRFGALMQEHKERLSRAMTREMGKVLAEARGDVQEGIDIAFLMAGEGRRMFGDTVPSELPDKWAMSIRQPIGVAGIITPWNFPIAIPCWKTMPALVAGNTVVYKPAEDTPLSTLFLTKLVKEVGIPDGVVNVVTGLGATAGEALATHPGLSRMSFTGSPEVGRLAAESCGRNLIPVKLELGGKGAAVLFDDIDVEKTVDALCGAVTLNTGQVCCTATRWLVHESIYDQFVERTRSRMAAVQIGYWNDPQTQMGPVVSQKQRERVLGYLEKAKQQGAEAIVPGGVAEVAGKPDGFYVKPAVLAGSPDNVAVREEIFGPVPYVLKFKAEEEAIELVNRSTYGLANSVWSQDLDRANRVAESLVAGNGWINAHNVFVHGVPYGGVNLSGLGGGVLGPDTLFDYLRSQSIVRPL